MNHGDGGTEHGGGGGMDHGDMGGMCSMNMIWNTQIIDTCIVFPQWHIRSHAHFVLSLVAIVALGVFYEWLRLYQKKLDVRVARSLAKGKARGATVIARRSPSPEQEDAGLLTGRPASKTLSAVPVPARILRATLYGSTVFLSFFLMLVFMTYNAYLILAVVVGAALGHYIFGGMMDIESILAGAGTDAKGMACH